jgi:endonuclease YncB( thermonuclease family)
MSRLATIVVLILTAPLAAQHPEFHWTDPQGQPRTARSADDVPRAEWQAVTVEVHGTEATSGERFRTTEGLTIVIEGIQAPGVEDDGTVLSLGGARARSRLTDLINEHRLTLEFEGNRRLPDGELLAHPKREDGRLLADLLLEEGAVRLCLEDGVMRHAGVLRDAQTRAQTAQRGVWAKRPRPTPSEPAFHRGVSLGLFAPSADFDYTGFLDEIRDVKASHVLLTSPWAMDDWQSNELWAVAGLTAGWPTVQRVTREALDRGLAVAYQPMIVLRAGTVEHWRGDIQPNQRWLWFRNYGRFIGRWADLARDLGVSLMSVGEELASLERDTGAWQAIIANVRSRFGGTLTYSANWDHFDIPGFWNDLDMVGMTGFFSLTNQDDPTVEEIVTAWRPIKERLLRFQAEVNKPILFTEIGYASQRGANQDPWDYFRFTRGGAAKAPDFGEQADCFAALFKTWGEAPPDVKGMYIWNWWRHEDPKTDFGYSVFGKPARAIIQNHYSAIADREKASPPGPK